VICSRRLISAAAAFAGCALLYPHDVITTKITFSREISRLLYKRCVSCHHDGGTAFSLVTYEQARPWAAAIKDETLSRRMPPWGAVKGFGEFQDDQGLTQEQLEVISNWVEGGAPEGDPKLLPPVPDCTNAAAQCGAKERGDPEGAVLVTGTTTLTRAMTLYAVEPKSVATNASIRVIAERPDGGIDPLLWLYEFNPKFAHPYVYRTPLHLPAGTKIEITPADGGSISLLGSTSVPKPGS